ncbi:MAG: accessory factor UbiK family protein [Cellvibrionales bacterium]|nr:accessory factor UbiK family protein [Cellvibrionales bacterium]
MSADRLSDQLADILQQSSPLFASLKTEARDQLRTLLDAQIEQMGLITRAEFDALRASLDRANDRLAKLEAQLAAAPKPTAVPPPAPPTLPKAPKRRR